MRELRRDVDASLEKRRHRTLPVQRLWTVLQDERPEPATHQAQEETGKCLDFPAILISFICCLLHD